MEHPDLNALLPWATNSAYSEIADILLRMSWGAAHGSPVATTTPSADVDLREREDVSSSVAWRWCASAGSKCPIKTLASRTITRASPHAGCVGSQVRTRRPERRPLPRRTASVDGDGLGIMSERITADENEPAQKRAGFVGEVGPGSACYL